MKNTGKVNNLMFPVDLELVAIVQVGIAIGQLHVRGLLRTEEHHGQTTTRNVFCHFHHLKIHSCIESILVRELQTISCL